MMGRLFRYFFQSVSVLYTIAQVANGQTADTLRFDPVEITASPSHHIPGSITWKSDTSDIQNYSLDPLPELLRKIAPVHIRDYGPGTLSSVSLRGTGSSHTAVFWNGLPVNQGHVGMYDLALLPVLPGLRLTLRTGGSASYYGNGAIGGTIHYDQESDYDNGNLISARYSNGSFGRNVYSGGIKSSNRRQSVMMNVYYDSADNDFTFINTAKSGSPEDTMKHSGYRRYGATLAWHILLNDSLEFSLHSWLSDAYRELPPLMTSGFSYAIQEDHSVRNTVRLKKIMKPGTLLFQSGFTSDRITYEDSYTKIFSETTSDLLYNSAEFNSSGNRIQLRLGTSLIYNPIKNTSYANNKAERFTFSMFGSVVRKFRRLRTNLTLSLREEVISENISALSGYAGAESKPVKWLTLKAGGGRVFRMPTMNDLYWTPGGNPSLKPETGWTTDGAAVAEKEWGRWQINLTGGIYRHLIDNWILWIPGSLGGLWSPENVRKVEARGTELSTQLRYASGRNKFTLKAHYSFTESTIRETYKGSTEATGYQLPYIPFNKGGGIATYSYRSTGVFFSVFKTGFVFTDPLNTRYLIGYSLVDAGFSTGMRKGISSIKVSLRVHNLLNIQYQSVEWRAMPGRYFFASLELSLIPKPKIKS